MSQNNNWQESLKLDEISNPRARSATERGIQNLMNAGVNLVENDSAFATTGTQTTGGGLVSNTPGDGSGFFGSPFGAGGMNGAHGSSMTWFPIALALNRRVSPTHIGNEICETIPLDRPYGMAFARRVIYDGFDLNDPMVQQEYRRGNLEADWRMSDILSGFSGGTGDLSDTDVLQNINVQNVQPNPDGSVSMIQGAMIGSQAAPGTQAVVLIPTGTGWRRSDGASFDAAGSVTEVADLNEAALYMRDQGKGMNFSNAENWRIRNWGALAQDITSGNLTVPDATANMPGVLEALGRTGMTGQKMPQLKFILDKRSIQCNTRKLAASFTQEDAMLMKGLHGLDVQVEMVNMLHKETLTEIDRELLGACFAAALDTDNEGGSAGIVDLANYQGDQRQVTAIVAGAILFAAAAVGKRTLLNSANKVIVSPSIYALLAQATPYFTKVEGKFDSLVLSGAETKKVGTLNGMIDVFVDPFARDTDYALVAYKGTAAGEAGVVYSPYLLNVSNIATSYEDWSLNAGVINTYAVTPNLLGSGNYYRLIVFENVNAAAGFTNTLQNWV